MFVDPDGFPQRENWEIYPVDDAVAALTTANPEECLGGSDWPHIMLADAKTPGSDYREYGSTIRLGFTGSSDPHTPPTSSTEVNFA